jgi:KaiC/GvpD/RAD55 family RecA-like ATPase
MPTTASTGRPHQAAQQAATTAAQRGARGAEVQPAGGARISCGNPLLDELLRGGIPAGAACLVEGPPFTGKEWVPAGFARAAAEAGRPLAVCLTGMFPERFRAIAQASRQHRAGQPPQHAHHGQHGQPTAGPAQALAGAWFVDCYGGLVAPGGAEAARRAAAIEAEAAGILAALASTRERYGPAPAASHPLLGHAATQAAQAPQAEVQQRGQDHGVVVADSPLDPEGLLRAVAQARASVQGQGLCVVVHTVSDLALRMGQAQAAAGHPWLVRLLAALRGWGATAVLVADGGVHQEQELAAMRAACDGTLQFHEGEDGRTFLRVRGLGGGATRAWIEYHERDDGLAITGSFTEQKIR